MIFDCRFFDLDYREENADEANDGHFGWGGNVKEVIGIAPDLKIKTPTPIDACLPDVAGFIVFLRP